MTSMEPPKVNTRWVSCFREADTAVTASELVRAWRMAGA
jgi:hypothetical protein